MRYPKIVTNLTEIQQLAADKQTENEAFRAYLSGLEGDQVDDKVAQLNTEIEATINCRSCGNCCKSLMIVVENDEADIVAEQLGETRISFDEKYLEKGTNGMMLINNMPCHFLRDNSCTIYEHRFAGCREFPALHIAGINKRLFTIFMHYDRCPIIFNVFELLKKETGFTTS